MERRDIVQLLAALDDAEFRALVDDARGQSLVPLAELVIEGLGPDIGYLSERLGDAVVVDDIGRQCVSRIEARNLFVARAERIREEKERLRREVEEHKAAREARARWRASRPRDMQMDPPDFEPGAAFIRGPLR